MSLHHTQRAFSLFELAAVVVVVGLVIGGVMAGKEMINAGQARALIADKDTYIAAANNFKVKYMGLPGDLKNATQYWGERATMPTCVNLRSEDKLTCNGNGDGRIFAIANSNPAYSYEGYRFWQHLTNADMITGIYSGVDEDGESLNTGGPHTYTPGVNVPEAARGGMYYRMRHFAGQVGADTYYFSGDGYTEYGNFLTLAKLGCAYCGLTVKEAKNIDQKLDDGSPAFGKVRNGKRSANNRCTTGTDPEEAEYDTENEEECILHFLTKL